MVVRVHPKALSEGQFLSLHREVCSGSHIGIPFVGKGEIHRLRNRSVILAVQSDCL